MGAESQVLASGTPRESGLEAAKYCKLQLLVILSVLFVLAMYVLIMMTSAWATRAQSTAANLGFTDYYDQLATAFLHGHLYLEAPPDPALLALPNPYPPGARTDIPYLLDMSLYQGRYYMYFGPVPAALLAIAKIIYPGNIGDQYLVLAFVSGILILESMLLVRLWRRYFRGVSPALVAFGVIVIGLVSPFGFVLREAYVYSAAIMGGQFFFLAGLYSAYSAVEGEAGKGWKLAVAGICWAAAVGCRITQIFAVAFMVAMVTFILLRRQPAMGGNSRSLQLLPAVFVPLILGAILLGWYNWARFGSIFETGIDYQLAGIPLQRWEAKTWSPSYVVQNLYNYLVMPPKKTNVFPFMKPDDGKEKNSVVPWIKLPGPYSAQQITGMAYTAPFAILALVPAVFVGLRRTTAQKDADQHGLLRWLIVSLCGSLVVEAAYLAVFFWAAERYMGDFMPELLLLSVLGAWELSLATYKNRAIHTAYMTLVLCAMTFSLVMSNLLISRMDYAEAGLPAPRWLQLIDAMLHR